MQIQAIVFDRDNTLVYFSPAQLAAIEARVAVMAPSLPPGAAARAWMRWPGPWPTHPDDEPAFWQQFWSALGAAHQLTPALSARLADTIGPIYHTCFAAFVDTAPTLLRLRQAGLRLAILTNFELPSVDRTLIHADLDPALFEVTLTSTVLGVSKPDPRAFYAAAAALRLPPSACAFVDDLAENVAVARSIGMRAYQIDRSLSPVDSADFRIGSLNLLLELLLPPSHHD